MCADKFLSPEQIEDVQKICRRLLLQMLSLAKPEGFVVVEPEDTATHHLLRVLAAWPQRNGLQRVVSLGAE